MCLDVEIHLTLSTTATVSPLPFDPIAVVVDIDIAPILIRMFTGAGGILFALVDEGKVAPMPLVRSAHGAHFLGRLLGPQRQQ